MGSLMVLLVLFGLSAFFSAAETALTSLSKIKVNRLLEHKILGAKLVHDLKEKPAEFIATILIGNNLVNIAASALATSMMINFFASHGAEGTGLAVGAATGLMTFLILAFGEITPKTIAIRRAEKFSLFVAPIIAFLNIVFHPVAFLMGFITRPFILLFGGKAPEKGPFITAEEIRLILAAGEKDGVIEEEEREMITSIFEFGETVAREVMTPRPDISACDINNDLSEMKKLVIESGHSRLPVFEKNLDSIVGILYAKDLLKAAPASVRDLLRPAIFIPETKKVAELLHEMQAARTHLAIIVDEYGMTSGLVTLEDLIEEIVGEIHDEFERDEKMVEEIGANTYLIDGKLSLNDLNDRLNLDLPVEDYDTIGGFVFGHLGKSPSVGQVVRLNKLLISVERVSHRRITRVKLVKLPETEDERVGG